MPRRGRARPSPYRSTAQPTARSPSDLDAPGPIFGLIGDYEVLEEIARGGMGVVYKARQRGANRLVALKMILAGQMASADERERFLREAELAANLDHQHIVPIYDVAEFQGCPYFSMKLVEGESLSDQIKAQETARGSRHDPMTAARLMATIARAVQYAHERGFLHCDLKPSNILLDREGRPYVTDFGLAKRASEDSAVSLSGAIMGTPSYMAPEQASGCPQGVAADDRRLWTGRDLLRAVDRPRPVPRRNGAGNRRRGARARPNPPARAVVPRCPEELETICLKCLEKSPQDRYASAAALADELDRYLQGEVIDATTLIPRLRRWNRREPELVARLGGLLLVALIAQFNYYVRVAQTLISGTITRSRGFSPSGPSRPSSSRQCCARAGSRTGSACSGRPPTSPSSRSSSSCSKQLLTTLDS